MAIFADTKKIATLINSGSLAELRVFQRKLNFALQKAFDQDNLNELSRWAKKVAAQVASLEQVERVANPQAFLASLEAPEDYVWSNR